MICVEVSLSTSIKFGSWSITLASSAITESCDASNGLLWKKMNGEHKYALSHERIHVITYVQAAHRHLHFHLFDEHPLVHD